MTMFVVRRGAPRPATVQRLRRWSSSLLTIALVATSVAAVGLVQTATAPAARARPEQLLAERRVHQLRAVSYFGADQTSTVPAGVHSVSVRAWGAGGGGVDSTYAANQAGGAGGGYATGTVAVTPGTAMGVVVGQGGQISENGSTTSTYGGGGPGGQHRLNTTGNPQMRNGSSAAACPACSRAPA